MRAAELPALTGIRFYAATLVYLAHVAYLPGLEPLRPLTVCNLGGFGVSLFFVLSGFILAYNYAAVFERGVRGGNWGRFVWARLSKIYPLHLLTMLLSIPIQIVSGHRPWSWGALGAHVSLAQCVVPFPGLPYVDYFNVPSWSISCELFFYLLAPLLIWLCFSAPRWQAVAAVACYAGLTVLAGKLSGADAWSITHFAPMRAFEFFAGVVAARLYCRGRPLSARGSVVCQVLGMLLLFASILATRRVSNSLSGVFPHLPGAVLLIYGLAGGQGRLARHLSGRLLTLLGLSSFAFYMIHDLVLRCVKGVFLKLGWSLGSGPSGMAIGLALGLFFFILTQWLSVLAFKRFESPVQNYLRSLIRKRELPTVAASKPCSPE